MTNKCLFIHDASESFMLSKYATKEINKILSIWYYNLKNAYFFLFFWIFVGHKLANIQINTQNKLCSRLVLHKNR